MTDHPYEALDIRSDPANGLQTQQQYGGNSSNTFEVQCVLSESRAELSPAHRSIKTTSTKRTNATMTRNTTREGWVQKTKTKDKIDSISTITYKQDPQDAPAGVRIYEMN